MQCTPQKNRYDCGIYKAKFIGFFFRWLLKKEQWFSSESVENACVRQQLLKDFSLQYADKCPDEIQLKLMEDAECCDVHKTRDGDWTITKKLSLAAEKSLKFLKGVKAIEHDINARDKWHHLMYTCCQTTQDGEFMCGFSCANEEEFMRHFTRHAITYRGSYTGVCRLCRTFALNNNEVSKHHRTGHGLCKADVTSMINFHCPFDFTPEKSQNNRVYFRYEKPKKN